MSISRNALVSDQLLVKRHLLAHHIEHDRKRQIESRADRGEQFAGGLFLTSLDLGQIAEADPRALGDFPKGLALRDPLLAQRLTDELAHQHRLRRGMGLHTETVPTLSDNTSAYHAHVFLIS